MTTFNLPFDIFDLGILNTGENVGFSLIPDQIRHISIKTGFHINLLVVGRRGLGASTLINSIFAAPLVEKTRGNEITVTNNEIYENDIKLSTVVATYHGEDAQAVLDYLHSRNMDYFENERGLKTEFVDKRIYGCIFLLPLDEIKQSEIEMMRLISQKCNFIPIIPKSDTFTTEELDVHKQKMMEMFKNNEINLYWPGITQDLDTELIQETHGIVQKYPLAVVASENIYEHKGEIIRGRKYRWGFIDIENEEISDFFNLRKILVHSFLDDLVYQTEINFYEKFRQQCVEDRELMTRIEEDVVAKLKQNINDMLVAKDSEKPKEVLEDIPEIEIAPDAGQIVEENVAGV